MTIYMLTMSIDHDDRDLNTDTIILPTAHYSIDSAIARARQLHAEWVSDVLVTFPEAEAELTLSETMPPKWIEPVPDGPYTFPDNYIILDNASTTWHGRAESPTEILNLLIYTLKEQLND